MFQVSEEDILPKHICVECWTKVMDFHKFYEAVVEARHIYLNSSVNKERPNFVEINCEAIEFDADIAFVKLEPSSDADDGADNSEETEYSKSGAHAAQNDSSESHVAAEQAIEIAAKLEDELTTENENFDHLISKYMEMHCELCQHPFATLSEASSHYRSKHQRRTATLKCCQRRIKMPDIRDHILYHLNPDLFK